MLKVERYIWGQLLISILITWLSLAMLFGLFDYLSELGDTQKSTRYGAFQALIYIFIGLPRVLYENFSYAVLIGTLMSLGQLANNHELVALRAAGFSPNQIVWTTLKLGILLACFAYAIGQWLAPEAQQAASAYKISRMQKDVAVGATGVWVKHNGSLISIEKVWSDSHLSGVTIYSVDQNIGGISQRRVAKDARLVQDQWVLTEVTDYTLNLEAPDHIKIDKIIATDLLPTDVVSLTQIDPEELSANALRDFIDHQKSNQLATGKLELAYWKHFTVPLSSLVMLLLATPLVFGFERQGGAGQRIFFGILIGIAYLLIDRLISRSALVWGMNPVTAAALPVLLFALCGLLILRRIR